MIQERLQSQVNTEMMAEEQEENEEEEDEEEEEEEEEKTLLEKLERCRVREPEVLPVVHVFVTVLRIVKHCNDLNSVS